MVKKKILFCRLEAADPAAVSERYGMSQVYAFEYLAAWAKKNCSSAGSYSFKTISFDPREIEEDVVFRIALEKPFAACFSCSVKNLGLCLRVARQVKLACPETLMIFGGPEMADAENIMGKNHSVDFSVVGEGEETFSELLDALARGGGFGGIRGLAFRGGAGAVRANARRPVIEDLAAVPPVFTRSRAQGAAGIVLYETGRGCPNKCSYCLWSPYRKRHFPLPRIKKELSSLLSNKNVERIWFIDSDFDSDPRRAKEIISFVKENRKHDLRLSAFLNFNTPDPELVELIGETFFEAPVGLQTVKPELLKNIGRAWFDLEKFEETIGMVSKHLPREKLYIDLMYGLPGEKSGDLLDSVAWCAARGLTHINFFRLAVFPGTPLRKNAGKFGLLFDPEPPHLVYSSDTFTYDEIIGIEGSIVNYKVLRAAAGDAAVVELAKTGALLRVLRTLHTCSPDFNSCFTWINESNIAEIDVVRLKPPVEKFLAGLSGSYNDAL